MHRNSIPSNKSESVLGFLVSSIPRGGFFSFPAAPRTACAGEHSRVTITPRTNKFRRPLTKTSLESLEHAAFSPGSIDARAKFIEKPSLLQLESLTGPQMPFLSF